jgi:hypothetical protein
MVQRTTDETECRNPSCSNDRREDVTEYSRRFCSDQCEVKYDHLRQDAQEAERAAKDGERPY